MGVGKGWGATGTKGKEKSGFTKPPRMKKTMKRRPKVVFA